jgi:hypothetical protein
VKVDIKIHVERSNEKAVIMLHENLLGDRHIEAD